LEFIMNVIAAAASSPLPAPMPPADFDLKVSLLGDVRAAALTAAVHVGVLDGFICDGELWVRRTDAQDQLPAGHCTYDETDACCFIPPDLIRQN
jgi:hypothetical protein